VVVALQYLDATRLLRVAPLTLVTYLTLLERHYRAHNSYHNSIHAADVVQSTFALLQHAALQARLTSHSLLTCSVTLYLADFSTGVRCSDGKSLDSLTQRRGYYPHSGLVVFSKIA